MPTFDLLHCPVCDDAGQGFTPLHESLSLPASRCNGCGLGIEHVLSVDPVGPYARPAYDATRNAGEGGGRWQRFHHDTAVSALRLAQLAPALPREPGTWVDVGCSNGAMITLLRRRGWKVMGVEADKATAAEVAQAVGVFATDFATWTAAARVTPVSAVEVVSFFDVIEHLLDPVGTLQLAAHTLAPGGVLVLEVPDLDQADTDFRNWRHRRITDKFTEHLWHFSARALDTLRVRHLAGMVKTREARPVPGRLQVAWQRDVSPVAPQSHTPSPEMLAFQLMSYPRDKRESVLTGMRAEAPDLYRQVAERMASFQTHAKTAV